MCVIIITLPKHLAALHEASSFTELHHCFTHVFHAGKATITEEMGLIILPTVLLVVCTL